jgi:hypothetical protein
LRHGRRGAEKQNRNRYEGIQSFHHSSLPFLIRSFCDIAPAQRNSATYCAASSVIVRGIAKPVTGLHFARTGRHKNGKQGCEQNSVLQNQRRQIESRKSANLDGAYPRFPSIIGATIIAAAILLSALILTAGTRYVAIETSNEETAWLVDRLTGNLYKCQAPAPGKASCEADVATGSVGKPRR